MTRDVEAAVFKSPPPLDDVIFRLNIFILKVFWQEFFFRLVKLKQFYAIIIILKI